MPLIRKKHAGKGRYFSPERYPNKHCERPPIGPERANIPPDPVPQRHRKRACPFTKNLSLRRNKTRPGKIFKKMTVFIEIFPKGLLDRMKQIGHRAFSAPLETMIKDSSQSPWPAGKISCHKPVYLDLVVTSARHPAVRTISILE